MLLKVHLFHFISYGESCQNRNDEHCSSKKRFKLIVYVYVWNIFARFLHKIWVHNKFFKKDLIVQGLYRVRNSYLKCHSKSCYPLSIDFNVIIFLIMAFSNHFLTIINQKFFAQPHSRGHWNMYIEPILCKFQNF